MPSLVSPVSTVIRPATVADLPACVAMGLHFARTVYVGRLEPDAGALERLGLWLLAHGAIFVADQDGEPVGMIGVCVMPHPMSGDITAFESFWWCNEDARGRGIRLLRHAEQWAREQGATLMQCVAPDARVCALYGRLGYEKIETAFTRKL